MRLHWLIGIAFLLSSSGCFAMDLADRNAMTPQNVLQSLKEGNQRFINNNPQHRNFQQEILKTKTKQFPTAVILSCMDSRNIPSLSFDQGIGDMLSVRIAGNILNNDILGSMEYGTSVLGARLIVVMGHTSCGAMVSACKQVELGNITNLLNKITPAVQQMKQQHSKSSCTQYQFVDQIAKQNVIDVIKEIPKRSSIIAKLLREKKIEIVGAMYNVSSGKVTFFNEITK